MEKEAVREKEFRKLYALRQKMCEDLGRFVERASQKGATPEEVEALPSAARALNDALCGCISLVGYLED